MVNYGLKDKVALITGANNPQGIAVWTGISRQTQAMLIVLRAG